MRNDKLKIFGERNTGTTVLKKIIQANSSTTCYGGTAGQFDKYVSYKVKILKLLSPTIAEIYLDYCFRNKGLNESWKHTATLFDSPNFVQNVSYLFLVRDPRSWILSMYKTRYNLGLRKTDDIKFNEFINKKFIPNKRDNLGLEPLRLLDLYNKKIASYVIFENQLKADKIDYNYLNFEKLVLSQREAFLQIKHLLIYPKNNFSEYAPSTKTKNKDAKFYQSYYAEKKWIEELADNMISIEDQVDWATFNKFGYFQGEFQ